MNAARNIILNEPNPVKPGTPARPPRGETPSELDQKLPSPETPLLDSLETPGVLRSLPLKQLHALAEEIRAVLLRLSEQRSVHFASNLGVVELAIALHSTLDFSQDRLLWDIGHQCYPHKLLTGRFPQFETIRTLGGLMGYPNPSESDYDLFMTGHAGCSVGAALGLACGDALRRPDENRHSVAVIGDGALADGAVFEALNHAGGLKKNITVILNDNKMSICGRVGGLARYLDRLRMAPAYIGLKNKVHRLIDAVPSLGNPAGRILTGTRDAIKAGLLGGMLFEEFGFRYIGPINGHDIGLLRKYIRMVREYKEPVLLHVLTEKGRGFRPAELDPTSYHAPSPEIVEPFGDGTEPDHADRTANAERKIAERLSSVSKMLPCDDNIDMVGKHSYTHWARNAIYRLMKDDERFCVITAAMTQGNMLEPLREEFPNRFFDVGICEEHAVVFAAGLAKSGMRPIVDIYSTFLQRAYDFLFQEISLQNLPVLFMIDRAGLVGADGPTHHGVFDIAYLRPFPNFTILAPGDSHDLEPMVRFAAGLNGPAAIRYPKTTASRIARAHSPIALGRAETLRTGRDGVIAVCGEPLQTALETAEYFASLPEKKRLDIGVVNARFVKPLDTATILVPLREGKFLVTAEEGMLAGGFGSAVLEAACDERVETRRLVRIGLKDQYVEHGTRSELLAETALDRAGFIAAVEKARR